MKKLRLIAMFALTFALVFGAASCKTEEDDGPWGDPLLEVIKEEKLKLSGTWKAIEGEVDANDAVKKAYENYYKIKWDNLNEKQMIQAAVEKCYLSDTELPGEAFLEIAGGMEALNSQYKDGPVEKTAAENKKYNVYEEGSILINGDRNQIKIEYYYKDDYPGNSWEYTAYVIFEKQ